MSDQSREIYFESRLIVKINKMSEKQSENIDSARYEMRKRRELMADKRRYIIYYTFGGQTADGETIAKNLPTNEETRKNENISEKREIKNV